MRQPLPSRICSAHRDGEDRQCLTCYPVVMTWEMSHYIWERVNSILVERMERNPITDIGRNERQQVIRNMSDDDRAMWEEVANDEELLRWMRTWSPDSALEGDGY